MKRSSGGFWLHALLLLCCLSLIGCSTSTPPEESGSASSSLGNAPGADPQVSDPVKITWFQSLRGQDPDTDRVITEIERINNIELEFIDTTPEQSEDRLTLMVSTGEHLDLVTGSPNAIAIQWARDGMLIPFDEYVKDGQNPYVEAILDNDLYNYMKVDDQYYFKLQPSWTGNRGYIINKKWLDNVGLDIPTTIDEYYEVIKAFQFGDPDGNGQDDTYGFYVAEPAGSNAFGYIQRAYLNSGAWGGTWCELPDGTISQVAVTDAARETFRFINKCYNEGLFNKSFVTEKDFDGKVQDLFVQETIGMTDMTVASILDLLTRYKDANKEIDFVYLPPLNTMDGQQGYLPHSGGWYQSHYMPKTCKNPEKVVAFLDWALTEEAREMTNFGIKGVHWTDYAMQNDMRIYSIVEEEMAKDWNTSDLGYTYPLSYTAFNYTNNAYIPLQENGFDLIAAMDNMVVCQDSTNSDFAYANWPMMNQPYAKIWPLQSISDPEVAVDPRLADIEIEGRTKAIIGSIEDFDANWDEMVQQFLTSGGQELIERGNAYYNAHK